jgi:hypothetical protein
MQHESFVYLYDKYRGEIEVPVSVEYEIIKERDGYGTGDSPTLIEVKNLKVYREGELITNHLDVETLQDIEDEIIEREIEWENNT